MSVQSSIQQKLQAAFQPHHLDVINESFMHAVPPGSESHFKVVIVADAFEGKRQVARHQAVYRALAEEMAGQVHALAVHTYTASEWQAIADAPASPECHGRSKQGH